MGTVGQGRWDLVFPSGAPDRIGDMFATAVVADAVRRFDADLAQTVETCRDWHREYRTVFRGMTALAIGSPAVCAGIATEGLRSARNLLRFVTGYTVAPLRSIDVESQATADTLRTGVVEGGAEPADRLEVPFRDGLLSGDALRGKLTDWRQHGIIEPGFAAAVERVIDHPEWLALPGFRVIVAGVTELAPLRPLLHWGADVLAIAPPGEQRWRDLTELARAGAGVLRYPIAAGPGADITRQFPALVHWIRAHLDDLRPVFGGYAHRPGPAGVRLAAAVDVLAEDLLSRRSDAVFALLGSPTDCYAVPETVVADAHRRRRDRGLRAVDQEVLRVLTRSALYQPSYRTHVTDQQGASWGIADALLPSQGPDHALSHRLLRWRASLAHTAGHPISVTVAPPAWTRAIRAQRTLAAAYRSAHRYGIEIFAPDTARTLLAAKLVADLCAPPPVDSDTNPEYLFALGAAHGGLWHQPFEPSSILPVAAATGCVRGLFGTH
ncbi:hypothetical protein [Nocardia sp. NPDC050710]|uniref:hypothetical protein n=1 Tax=Nocardia sp. NPDC050710 TaxID=3157220 RepID=UPI003405337F